MKQYTALIMMILLCAVVAQAQETQQANKPIAGTAITNSVGMKFVLIPAGTFTMGTEEKQAVYDNEVPSHTVTISKPYYMGVYEVTQDQWEAVMDSNPSYRKCGNCPVETVSYYDVLAFIKALNEKEETTRYRLPTEAEWEYACRAGSKGAFCFGDDEDLLYRYAWFMDDEKEGPQPVGRKRANTWGLYDMHGNVWEWVQDWYAEDYYENSPEADPTGPVDGTYRIFRGGSWLISAAGCRCARRVFIAPGGAALDYLGVRLVYEAQ